MNTTSPNCSPVLLSYAAALRKHKPRRPGTPFSYAQFDCRSPELLIGLAASNPEGQFFGLVADVAMAAKAMAAASERQVLNVSFMETSAAKLPPLDYIVCDDAHRTLSSQAQKALFDLAGTSLKPGGLFGYSYPAYKEPQDLLRFLVREFSAEMDGNEAANFLLELKKLGHLYFKVRPDLAQKLDRAIAKNMPDDFFALFDEGEASAASFDTVVAMRSRGMLYAGSGQIEANYVELMLPPGAQEIVIACNKNPLVEPIKDFASLRAIRSDIWCKPPAAMSKDKAELFGGFAYGITLAEEEVPASVDVFGKNVDLSGSLYKKLIEMMTMQPGGIGDFMQLPESAAFPVDDVVEAVQILVALGIARPMRGAREASNLSSMAQPRFCGSFNRYIDRMAVTTDALQMASRVMGDVVSVSPQDALVMQALNRAGLANSVSALLPELERLAHDQTSSSVEATAEAAHNMINDSVTRSFVQWYAYGLLEAA